jgi:hypothetical protein
MGGVTEEYGAMVGWELAGGRGKSHRKASSRSHFYTLNPKRR